MPDSEKDLEIEQVEMADLQVKIDQLNTLAWELRDIDLERSFHLSEDANLLSRSGPFHEENYRTGLFTSLRGLAHYNLRTGELALSLSQSIQALSLLESAAMPAVEVDILRNIAIILGTLGNYAEGLEYALKALHLAQSMGDRGREAAVLGSMGVIHMHSKNTDESLRMFRQALQLNRELGQLREEGINNNNMSIAYRAQGDFENALTTSFQALQLAEETQFSTLTITATGTIGEAYLAMRNYDQAYIYFQKYLAAAQSGKSKRNEAYAWILLGETDLRQNHTEAAYSHLSQALTITNQMGLRAEEARCHELLAEVYEQQNDLKQALDQLRLFCRVKETLFTEDTAKQIANLQVFHQVETAKRDAEIHSLRTAELQREIEDRKKNEAALELLAATDPLTGVLNKREFFDVAEGKNQTALQNHQFVSLILLDVDHFKSINDNYGHAIGDQVLITIARIIGENLRKDEIVGRIGGDEFAILLPGSNGHQGQQIARRLKKKIISHPFESDQGAFTLTASMGVAVFDRTREENLSDLLEHADQAMYTAKRAGRNRITTYRAMNSQKG